MCDLRKGFGLHSTDEAYRSFYSFVYKAVCTSCRKKHAEQLVALGWQSTDKRTKDKADQASAASTTDLQRFVGQFIFLKTVLFSLACPVFLFLCQPRENKTFKIRCVRKLVTLFVFPFVMCRKGPSYKPIPLPPPSSLAPNCLKCRGACFLKMSTPFAYTVNSLSNFFPFFQIC